ncbi:hypothetical protein PRIPAC_74111 [Pristionchus pacificus]|uniref:Uncharacterized protein n=1 Tax=Pristionchus pacificus TaxID=54126 RepID=A0A2A6C0E0_PRIPA|nr:hypothetical protein PRIPAC_74111 [Pristionchus pacificus]|eukprot:PDM71722.1 hypothetical protein PRIPAC_38129 [Pristionchus pacificus]
MLPQCLLSLLILTTAVHSRVLDSNVDCTILLSCMDNEDCVRVTARRFDVEYCLDEDIPSIMEKRASSLRKILLSNLGSRMSGGRK